MLVIEHIDNHRLTVQSAITGDLVGENIDQAKETFGRLLKDGYVHWVCNCANVDLVDSTFLAFLGWVNRSLAPHGGRFSLVSIPAHLNRLLELANMGVLAPTLAYTLRSENAADVVSLGELVRQIEFELNPKFESLAAERHRVEQALHELPMGASFIDDVRIAFGEGLANAYRYGLRGQATDAVSVEISVHKQGVVLVVSDNGLGFIDQKAEVTDHLGHGGRGILFMRQLMDVVTFEQGEQGGTTVRMVKYAHKE